MKPLQPSTSSFRDLIEGGYLYVDKTHWIYDLVRGTKGIYFLSRPRRFGKSLLISTLDEIFQGNKELFQGLYLYESDYSWGSYPIIRLDFSQESVKTADELEDVICEYIREIATDYNITPANASHQRMFRRLIRQLGEKKQVVILIDEYDNPLIDNLENIEEAKAIRDVMKAFYKVIKAMDRYIRFVFITGVSKFSQVSIFSELNHLTDLTMRNSFSAALGLTEDEIRHYFADRIPHFAQQEELTEEGLLDLIRAWYNGFRFAPEGENVYNPFSTMQLFDSQQFEPYWFESGTPTFLIKLIHQERYDPKELSELTLDRLAFSTYDLENLSLIPLLFQTGYLTIKGYDRETMCYTLDYPNYEVESAFQSHLLDTFSNLKQGFSIHYLWEMIEALRSQDIDAFFKIMQALFANIDYDLHLKYEKYYQTIFYLLFKLMGLRIQAEVKTNDGRIDAVVDLKDRIYLFEFKLDGKAQEALDQIKKKQYFQKYWLRSKPILLIGANFDTKTRTVDDWEVEEMVI